MSKTGKIHSTYGFKFTKSGRITFLTKCGKRYKNHKSRINGTVWPDAVNCKTCLKILNKTNHETTHNYHFNLGDPV